MPKLPRVKAERVIKILLKIGFHVHHYSGSHCNLRHKTKSYLHIVVPKHQWELAPKTLKTILVQAEISVEEFISQL